ncbi:MAG: hypothetical protein L7U87_08110 [Chlamydiales bacterium]|nr:hypothetical protein [Chlamydiales bacterium]
MSSVSLLSRFRELTHYIPSFIPAPTLRNISDIYIPTIGLVAVASGTVYMFLKPRIWRHETSEVQEVAEKEKSHLDKVKELIIRGDFTAKLQGPTKGREKEAAVELAHSTTNIAQRVLVADRDTAELEPFLYLYNYFQALEYAPVSFLDPENTSFELDLKSMLATLVFFSGKDHVKEVLCRLSPECKALFIVEEEHYSFLKPPFSEEVLTDFALSDEEDASSSVEESIHLDDLVASLEPGQKSSTHLSVLYKLLRFVLYGSCLDIDVDAMQEFKSLVSMDSVSAFLSLFTTDEKLEKAAASLEAFAQERTQISGNSIYTEELAKEANALLVSALFFPKLVESSGASSSLGRVYSAFKDELEAIYKRHYSNSLRESFLDKQIVLKLVINEVIARKSSGS